MRQDILKKFEGVSHKWFYVDIEDINFKYVMSALENSIRQGLFLAKDSIDLMKAFKIKNKAFVKLKSLRGRSNISCICELVTKENKKFSFEIPGNIVLRFDVIGGTPKKLKLYDLSKESNDWQKPNDGFDDDFDFPLDEEFTELGYKMYKEYQLELRRLNVTSKEYNRNIERYYK